MARKNGNPPPWKRGNKWVGKIDVDGRQIWVGSFDTPGEWKLAAAAKRLEAATEAARRRENLAQHTMRIDEYAGDEPGKWPWNRPKGRRESSLRNHAYNIRPIVRDYGDRLLRGGIGRREAIEIAHRYPEGVTRSVRAMFNEAIDEELADRNPFAGLRLEHSPGRRDIDVLTPDEVDLLCQLALEAWPNDEYGKVFSAFLRWQAETCMRPGETCATTWPDIDFDRNRIAVRRSRTARGKDTDPKVEKTRIVLPPRAKQAVLAMPRLNAVWVFPNQRGNRLLKATLSRYWYMVRPLLRYHLPEGHWLRRRIEEGGDYDLYELRHFGATWLLEDPPYGLGLPPRDVAHQFGHLDGGGRIMRLYGHPSARESRRRLDEAFQADWERRNALERGQEDEDA